MKKVEKKNQFKTFRASLFNEDLSNEPNFGRSISLDSTFNPCQAVLRIRDDYPGSDFFPSRIRTVSIPDPHQRI
jgi:hypothetical protein